MIESNSFLTDKRLNDNISINNRIKSLINHKNIRTSFIKDSILLQLNNTNRIKKIINNIIKNRKKIIKLNRYFNAKRVADNLRNLFKSKKNSEVDKQINTLTNNDNRPSFNNLLSSINAPRQRRPSFFKNINQQWDILNPCE